MPIEILLAILVGIILFDIVYSSQESPLKTFCCISRLISLLLSFWILIWFINDAPIIKTEEAKVEYRTMYNPDGAKFQQQIAQFSDKAYNLTEEKKQIFPNNTIVIREVSKPIHYGIIFPYETYKIKYAE